MLFVKMDGERFAIDTAPWTAIVRNGEEFHRTDPHRFDEVLELVRRHAPELYEDLFLLADDLAGTFEKIGRTGRVLILTHDDNGWSLNEHGTVLGTFPSLEECVIRASALV